MVDTSVKLCGITLDNPVIPASGTFGFGYEFTRFYDINILGSISLKGTTIKPRFGNPTPRIAECPSGLLNAVGLQNPGAEKVLNCELKTLKQAYKKPVMANISGFSADDYVSAVQTLDGDSAVGWFEVNISCPNVHGGGLAFGTSTEGAAKITKAVRHATDKPIIIKLSPNVTDIAEIARACEAEGADGVSLINTLLGMKIDLKTKKPLLANKTGGLSGPAVKPVAVRMVYQVYEAVKIPIVGMGGITSAEDVIEFMLAGATAAEVGAANLTDPYACKKIIENLPLAMEKYGIENLSEIIGGAHNG